jgi:hypothetical protein
MEMVGENYQLFGNYIPIVCRGVIDHKNPENRYFNERYLRCARRIRLHPGDLLIWDSRTIHQGWGGGYRLAMPICWEPRSRRTDETFARKVRLCALGLPSTHWASLGLQHNITFEESRKPESELCSLGPDDPFEVGTMPDNGDPAVPAAAIPLVRLPVRSSIKPVCWGAELQAMDQHEAESTVVDLCKQLEGSDYKCEVTLGKLLSLLDPYYVKFL